MTGVAIIQARYSSTRLPGKVLLPLGSTTVLGQVVKRARAIAGIDSVVIAVPVGAANDPVAEHAQALGATVARGPEEDVLRRYRLAADLVDAEWILRITSDCPLLDPAMAAVVLAAARARDGYARTALRSGVPLGLDVEALPVRLLRMMDDVASDPAEREHVTPYLWRRPDVFPSFHLDRVPDRRGWRLTIDEPADYAMLQAIFDAAAGTLEEDFRFETLEALLCRNPDLLYINEHVAHKRPAGLPDHRQDKE